MFVVAAVAVTVAVLALNQPGPSQEAIDETNRQIEADRVAREEAEGAAREAKLEAKRTRLTTPPDRALSVVFLGDSLSTDSYSSTRELGWTSLVAAGLGAYGSVERTVEATAGQTVAAALRRDIPSGADLVLVQLGTNDVGGRTEPAKFEATYREYLGMVLAASPDSKVICITPWNTAARSTAYTAAITAVCGEVGATVMDIAPIYSRPDTRAHKGEAYFGGIVPDDAHPNDRGHRMIADLVLDWIVVG